MTLFRKKIHNEAVGAYLNFLSESSYAMINNEL